MIKPVEEIMGGWGLKSWGDYIKLGGVITHEALLCVQRKRPLSTGHVRAFPMFVLPFMWSCTVCICVCCIRLQTAWTLMKIYGRSLSYVDPTPLRANWLVCYPFIHCLCHQCVSQSASSPYVFTTESFGVNRQLGLSRPISSGLRQRSPSNCRWDQTAF